MRKKTIAILFGIGFGVAIVATVFYFGGIFVFASAASSCDYSSSYSCDASPMGGVALLLVGGLFYLAGGILSTIAWIATLIKQAQRQQWAWFICTLLFSGICMLIWLIVEPEVPQVRYAPVYQPIQPGYPPAYPPENPYPSTSYPPSDPYSRDPYRPQ
ncbi:MAG TPA: hypothetical protein VHD63_24340 [Ktedonobacteraceae bacterium]|nr:hypothetical protein [Ktedonobacteraceae bacterium]